MKVGINAMSCDLNNSAHWLWLVTFIQADDYSALYHDHTVGEQIKSSRQQVCSQTLIKLLRSCVPQAPVPLYDPEQTTEQQACLIN